MANGGSQRRARALNVFVSSPGDCAEERGIARSVVERVSASMMASAARLELRPLLWEQLPPGPGTTGDTQARINDLLRRYGLRRYEIYLGFMKARIGTATPRQSSGTVEEFESALQSQRRAGHPAEVLFYFRDDGTAPEQGVVDFRESLERRGFLYSTVHSLAEFEQRIEEHLLRVVAEWHWFRNRLRRQIHYLRPMAKYAVATALVVLVALYWRFDLGGKQRVLHAAESSAPLDALAQWNENSPYMVVHRSRAREGLNRRIADYLVVHADVNAALDGFERWASHDARLPAHVAATAIRIAERVEREIVAASQRNTGTGPLSLWRRTATSRVWDFASEQRGRALRWLAGQQLFIAVVGDTTAAVDWSNSGLRRFELDAVRRFADRLVQTSGFVGFGTRAHRLAAALLAEDWTVLERLATSALGLGHSDSHPELRAFAEFAPVERVCAWISEHVLPKLAGHVFRAVEEGAKARRSPRISMALLDLVVAGLTPYNPFETDSDTLIGLRPGDQDVTAEVQARLLEWIRADVPPSAAVFEVCLPHVRVGLLDAPAKEQLSAWFIAALTDGDRLEEAEIAIQDFLGRLATPAAATFLAGRRAPYLAGTTSWGTGERAALIRGLNDLPMERPDREALRMAVATRENAKANDYDDSAVQAEYLRVLRRHGREHWAEHVDFLRRLAADRVLARRWWDTTGTFARTLSNGLWLNEFDGEMAALFKELLPAEIVGLFEFPAERDPAHEFDGTWDRWLYLIERLAASGRLWPPEFVGKLTANLPTEKKLGDHVLELLATHGGEAAAEYFRRSISVRPLAWLRYVGVAGDVDTLQWAGGTFAASPELVQAALDGAELLDAETYRGFVSRLMASGEPATQLIPILWYHCSRVQLADKRLEAAAIAAIVEASDANLVVGALRYCQRTASQHLSEILGDVDRTVALAQLLERESAFFLYNIGSDFRLSPGPSLPPVLERLIRARPLVAVLTKEQVGRELAASVNGALIMSPEGEPQPAEPNDYFAVAGRFVRSELLATAAAICPEQTGALLLELHRSVANQVEILGERVSDPTNYFRAYCWWLAAGLVAGHEAVSLGVVVDELARQDPMWVRAAAGLALALTK